jgi:hypothetical protein
MIIRFDLNLGRLVAVGGHEKGEFVTESIRSSLDGKSEIFLRRQKTSS